MNNIIKNIKKAMVKTRRRAEAAINCVVGFNRRALCGNAGEGYIDTAIKILIAVVLGALLLFALYALFGDTVLPQLEDSINDMFGYGGAVDQLG